MPFDYISRPVSTVNCNQRIKLTPNGPTRIIERKEWNATTGKITLWFENDPEPEVFKETDRLHVLAMKSKES